MKSISVNAISSQLDIQITTLLSACLFGVVFLLASCSVPPEQPVPKAIPNFPKTAYSAMFPLMQTEGNRCFVGQDGKPFLFHGDAAWSLLVQLTQEKADRYLDERRRQGFNTLIINLLEHHFSHDPPRNAFGDAPFLVPGDFATPNEKYFAHADWLIQRAAERGFLILLAPAYLGYEGGSQGWYQEMRNSGPDRMRMFGRYLGKRYQNMRNVIWLHGGDYDPPDRSTMLALVEGIRSSNFGALHSFHGVRGMAARISLGFDGKWLNLNTVYTNRNNVISASLKERSSSALPFIFVEGQYENDDATELIVRAQAFQAMFSGACGHVMGNKPVWAFERGWEESLDSPGARSMTRLREFLDAFRWPEIEPGPSGFILQGAGTGVEQAVASISADGRRAFVYIPTGRTVLFNSTYLKGSRVTKRWIDPASGKSSEVSEILLASGRQISVVTPGKNSSGYEDWLLVLEFA